MQISILIATMFCVLLTGEPESTNSNKVQFYDHKNTALNNKANWSYFEDCYPQLYDSIVEYSSTSSSRLGRDY